MALNLPDDTLINMLNYLSVQELLKLYHVCGTLHADPKQTTMANHDQLAIEMHVSRWKASILIILFLKHTPKDVLRQEILLKNGVRHLDRHLEKNSIFQHGLLLSMYSPFASIPHQLGGLLLLCRLQKLSLNVEEKWIQFLTIPRIHIMYAHGKYARYPLSSLAENGGKAILTRLIHQFSQKQLDNLYRYLEKILGYSLYEEKGTGNIEEVLLPLAPKLNQVQITRIYERNSSLVWTDKVSAIRNWIALLPHLIDENQINPIIAWVMQLDMDNYAYINMNMIKMSRHLFDLVAAISHCLSSTQTEQIAIKIVGPHDKLHSSHFWRGAITNRANAFSNLLPNLEDEKIAELFNTLLLSIRGLDIAGIMLTLQSSFSSYGIDNKKNDRKQYALSMLTVMQHRLNQPQVNRLIECFIPILKQPCLNNCGWRETRELVLNLITLLASRVRATHIEHIHSYINLNINGDYRDSPQTIQKVMSALLTKFTPTQVAHIYTTSAQKSTNDGFFNHNYTAWLIMAVLFPKLESSQAAHFHEQLMLNDFVAFDFQNNNFAVRCGNDAAVFVAQLIAVLPNYSDKIYQKVIGARWLYSTLISIYLTLLPQLNQNQIYTLYHQILDNQLQRSLILIGREYSLDKLCDLFNRLLLGLAQPDIDSGFEKIIHMVTINQATLIEPSIQVCRELLICFVSSNRLNEEQISRIGQTIKPSYQAQRTLPLMCSLVLQNKINVADLSFFSNNKHDVMVLELFQSITSQAAKPLSDIEITYHLSSKQRLFPAISAENNHLADVSQPNSKHLKLK